jgi:hypothetical protein
MNMDGLRSRTSSAAGAARQSAGNMARGARSVTRRARGSADDGVHGVMSLLPVARAQADELAEHIPEIVDHARAGAFETRRTLEAMPEPTLKELAVGSISLAAGLYVAGAPRLVVLAAIAPGVLAAGTIATRRPGHALR